MMRKGKAFRGVITIFIILNLGSVFLLASNKDTKLNENELAQYKEMLVENKKSILESNDVDEVIIEANTDLGLITEAPIAAKVGKEMVFMVNSTYSGDVMKVQGMNEYEVVLESKDYGEYTWIPERAGVFDMVLIDRENNERTRRRINVASEKREDIYELTPITYEEDEKNNVTFTTSIFNTPTGTDESKAIPTTAFTIGESGIWTKTVKGYGSLIEDPDRARTSIVEGKDFLLDRGNYTVTATLKDLYSVEAEDTKTINYEKKPIDGHEVVIDDIEVIGKQNEQGQAVEDIIVHARCKHDKTLGSRGCDLVYAFSIDDSVGTKNIVGSLNGYTENNELIIPNIRWSYTVTVKVKHKNNSEINGIEERLLLPNAYEAIATKNIIKQEREAYDEIEIKNIKVQSSLLDDYYEDVSKPLLPTQILTNENQVGTMYVNSNNYITVNLEDSENAEKLQYTATIMQDGQSFPLEAVYTSKNDKVGNTFIYYPKTGGSKSYNKNKTATLSIIVAEIDSSGSMVRRTIKNIGVNIK